MAALAQPVTTQPATTQPAAAQTQPNRAPAAQRGPWLHFDTLGFDLAFESNASQRHVTTNRRNLYLGPQRQTNTDWRFEETLGFASSGWIYSDRLLHYDVSGRWGLSQEIFREDRRNARRDLRSSPSGDVLEYDLHFELFPAGKLSATAWASQLDDRIPRPFLPSLDRRRERYGAGLFFNDPKLPMSLRWEHTFDRLSSGRDFLLDDEDRRDESLRYEATWQPSDYHTLNLQYEYEQRKEKFSGSDPRFDTTRHELTVDHVLRFGRDHANSLETFARLNEESGDLARDTAQFHPVLRLRWTDRFSTTLGGEFLRESFAGLEVKTTRGDLVFTHDTTDWLTNSLEFYGQFDDANKNADVTEWGGILSSSLNRKTPWGRLSASASYTHVAQHSGGGERDGVVLTETVTFRDPLPAYLAQRDIILRTLVVTDAQRGRVYLFGRDYLILRVGRAVSLVRVRNGRITDGQTVVVSYRYRAFRNYDLHRDRIDYRIQHDFDFGLTPYFAGSVQNEDIGSGRFLRFRARNVNRQRIGVNYRRPRWSAGLEYEFNDDGIDPYQGVHANGDVVLLTSARHQLSANTHFSRFWFDGARRLDTRTSSLFDAGVSYRTMLGRRLEGNADLRYRYEDDSIFGDTHGVDLKTALTYHIGLLAISLEVEYDVLDLPGSTDGTVEAWVKIKRDIPVIGARR